MALLPCEARTECSKEKIFKRGRGSQWTQTRRENITEKEKLAQRLFPTEWFHKEASRLPLVSLVFSACFWARTAWFAKGQCAKVCVVHLTCMPHLWKCQIFRVLAVIKHLTESYWLWLSSAALDRCRSIFLHLCIKGHASTHSKTITGTSGTSVWVSFSKDLASSILTSASLPAGSESRGLILKGTWHVGLWCTEISREGVSLAQTCSRPCLVLPPNMAISSAANPTGIFKIFVIFRPKGKMGTARGLPTRYSAGAWSSYLEVTRSFSAELPMPDPCTLINFLSERLPI